MTIESLLKKGISLCVAELERLLLPVGKTVEFIEESYQVVEPMSATVIQEVKAICTLLEENNHKAHLEVYQGVRVAQVRSDLSILEDAHAQEWEALQEDVPYQKGTHPLKEYQVLVTELLRGESRLWASTLTHNEEALQALNAICEVIVMELQKMLTPMLLDDELEKTSSQIIHQTNAFLIRLEMLDVFMDGFDELVDLCKPDMRHESTASITLLTLRNAIIESCVDSINTLLKSSQDSGPPNNHNLLGSSGAGVGSGFTSGLGLLSSSHHASSAGNSSPTLSTSDNSTKAGARVIPGVNNPGESCDLHSITGNVLHCCKELVEYESIYRRLFDLASGIHITLPPNALNLSNLISSLMDNLYVSLLKRADRFNVVRRPTSDGNAHSSWVFFSGGKSSSSSSSTSSLSSAGFPPFVAPNFNVPFRPINIELHKLYDTGNVEAEILMSVSRRHLFLANNLFSLFVYIREMQKNLQTKSETDAAAVKGKKMPPPTVSQTAALAAAFAHLQTFSGTVEVRLTEEQKLFCNVVAGAMALLPADMESFIELHAQDHGATNRLLKAKFSLFNSGMEALLAQQGEWRIHSLGLRDHVGLMLLSKILPIYQTFYHTYASIKFSKRHLAQYTRFPPQDVERILQHFFSSI